MEKITQLSTKDILDKEFKTSIRGYNQEEVDKFLDLIIKDYEAMQQRIDQLEQENNKLKTTAIKQPEKPVRPTQVTGNTNYDILKRLSNLEKHVFGSKLFD
ncbi:cell division regulator GpsB [Anaerobacillus sp. MEB173]|uniref:cell division regulator GpsB n=1 Tax=Anaerobacillus sp. MEB173 TaxID=3383345 RepID=UPI003F9297F0